MQRYRTGANRPRTRHMHKAVAVMGLAAVAWTILAIWILFSHSYYRILVFGVVTFTVGMFVVLPWLLLRLRRYFDEPEPRRPFREWLQSEFETASGPVEAQDAVIMILLIPMGIALAMTAFGLIEFLLAEGHFD